MAALNIASGSGFVICQIIGQNQARVRFFKNRYLGESTFVFTFYGVNLPLGKFGPHPGGSYRG